MKAAIKENITHPRQKAKDFNQLFIVLIDENCGNPVMNGTSWVENSEPKILFWALEEAADLRSKGWICKLEPVL